MKDTPDPPNITRLDVMDWLPYLAEKTFLKMKRSP